MATTRRQFISATGASLAASALQRTYGDLPPTPVIPNFRDTLLANGYNPDLPDSALLAVIGDVHFNLYYQDKLIETFDDVLVDELNGLQPSLTHLAIAGDLIVSNSLTVGTIRYPSHYAIARQEMRLLMSQLPRFRPDLEVILTPGNHDTDNQDNHAGGVPQLWMEEIARPPYQKRVMGGVPVFFLDTGHAGNLGPVQAQWFASEAAKIHPDQEVLIVAHHPSFYSIVGETGLKRKVTNAFAGHRAPVWVIGGHGHGFHEELYVDKGTKFIQLEVTAGTAKAWSDGQAPGYALLGLQEGRLTTRIFRSVLNDGTHIRKPLEQLTSQTLRWPFDRIEYPGELYVEGDYDRSGRLISFNGSDLLTHFGYLKEIIWKADLSRFCGRISDFLICASMGSSTLPTVTCSFSDVGPSGPWVDLPFPAADDSKVFAIPIPEQFRSATQLYVKMLTSMDRYDADISVGGWGLASNSTLFNNYEKWLCKTYQTFVLDETTHPDSITPGTTNSNLVNYAFNLLHAQAIPITGMPSYTKVPMDILDYRFARRTVDANPGVSYIVEESLNMKDWTIVAESRLAVKATEPGWEEVAYSMAVRPGATGFCRVRVEETDAAGSGFQTWRQQSAMPGGTNGDVDADKFSDILQFGFGIPTGEGSARIYNPDLPSRRTGLPLLRRQSSMASRLVFPRLRQSSDPDVQYIIEASNDLSEWTAVPTEQLSETVLRTYGDWDELKTIIMDSAISSRYYRVKVVLNSSPKP